MDALKAVFPCFPQARRLAATEKQPYGSLVDKSSEQYDTFDEKPRIMRAKNAGTAPTITIQQAADSIVSAFQSAQSAGPSLDATIHSLVHQAGGWSEWLAQAVLSALEAVLKAGIMLEGAMKVAYDKACEAAKAIEGFAAEHPLATAVFCTVIALGILSLLAPYVLGALGFAEVGIVEGSWAALWQATYRGFVSRGSLFSFFQRLGMTWHWF